MEKNELLEKGNNLVEKINAAIANVEVVDIAKGQIAQPNAELCINIHHEDTEVMDIYELRKVLDDKSLEKIKAFIMTELDLAQHESLAFLENIGVTVTAPAGDTYTETDDDPEDFELLDVPETEDAEPKKWTDEELCRMYGSGMSCPDIAKETGIPKSTVWYRITKAMDSLKKEGAKRGKR